LHFVFGELCQVCFDFINIGTQKAEGLATTHLFLSSSLSAPSLQGTFHLANGTYQNYAIGTRLKNIDAEIEAERGSLVIKALTAEGKKGGMIEATGSMQLSPKLHMPFEIQGKLKDIQFLNFDFLSSSFTGDLTLEGTTEAALLKGQVEATNIDVSLSEEIPAKIPELDINYVNRPVHIQGAKLSSQTFYPFNYDVKIETKDRVFIKGRGLDSLWKGDLHLLGHNAEVSAEGRLSLVKGDYIFAGKKFSLQEGEITFVDKPTPQAFIKIGGMLQLYDVQVMVSVQGPLESPTFTMHSIPHMPTSALLSRILFNKDISEITAVEALQLANVLVSMTGTTGPDVLENIRRSIGVDRLTIVGKEGSDEISLQIGWYLTHGVTVSLSQSATSSDVTIEVDLKHGFIFQAETQNQEEGKFSLKWNKNY
jgi:translocation and assembly module TamB